MSIITKRGDRGQTDLMYGRRVAKTDVQVAAYGAVDELNATLGLVRVRPELSSLALEFVEQVQEQLIGLMGDLATAREDRERYQQDGYRSLGEQEVQWLESRARELERSCDQKFNDWARPGGERCPAAAYLDLARAVCRRAERDVLQMKEQERLEKEEIPLYLNRLSDALWILARHEAKSAAA